ncbi:helix-turn-helix domain-containing protein [Halorubrum terrestre]|uniref:Helix-turn-helix domain-containing protein n=1 Tax=Halorubrum distributum TaxID=29283 RepID=A0A6B1IND1_9EURY|nr:winged helix-turn-helix domain-containing protein [Halorubrum terrestre]MYL17220.1 helix-turn-helix domain-containing protein [Halorubrum terrestre]
MTANPVTVDSDGRSATPEADINRGLDSSPEELLALFGDEYTCDILTSLEEGPKPARALAEDCGMSRPTVYRRLNRLADAGLVDERLQYASDGNHRKEFYLVVSAVSFDLSEDGLAGYLNPSSRDID